MKNFFYHFFLFLFASLLLSSCNSLRNQSDLLAIMTKPQPVSDQDSLEKGPENWVTIAELKAQADTGSTDAMYNIAQYYENKNHFPEAAEWFKKAADLGYPGAEKGLIRAYMGYKPRKGIRCYKKMAKTDPGAMYELSQIYLMRNRYLKALRWGIKAVRADEPQALLSVAYMLRDSQSFEYFMRAAQVGEEEGMYEVGRYYRYGLGRSADPVLAAQWFSKAAMEFHPNALMALSEMFREGEGVPVDQKKAETLERIARQMYYSPLFDSKEQLQAFKSALQEILGPLLK